MIHNGSPTCRLLVQEETRRYMNDESDYTLLWKFPFTLRHLHVPSTSFLSGSWGRTELFLVFYCQFCIAVIIPRLPFWIQFHQLDINFEIPSSFNFLIQFHLTTRGNCQKSIKSDLICSTLISPTQYFSRFIFTILISFNSMISSFAFVTLLGTLINRPIPKYT